MKVSQVLVTNESLVKELVDFRGIDFLMSAKVLEFIHFPYIHRL